MSSLECNEEKKTNGKAPPTTNGEARKKKALRQRRRDRPKKHTYSLDAATRRDLAHIQIAARATSASEAVKLAIRRFAQIIRYAKKGYEISAVSLGTDKTVVIDVPGMKIDDPMEESDGNSISN